MHKQTFFEKSKPLTHEEINEKMKKMMKERPNTSAHFLKTVEKPLTHEEINEKMKKMVEDHPLRFNKG